MFPSHAHMYTYINIPSLQRKISSRADGDSRTHITIMFIMIFRAYLPALLVANSVDEFATSQKSGIYIWPVSRECD